MNPAPMALNGYRPISGHGSVSRFCSAVFSPSRVTSAGNLKRESALSCLATLLAPHPATAGRAYSSLTPCHLPNCYRAVRLGILTGSLTLGLGVPLRSLGNRWIL
jgi:hypothetical protein